MSIIKKFVVGLAVVALVCVGGVSVASAQTPTIDQLMAEIARLSSTLAGLQGGGSTGVSACTFTRPLTVGARGADVSCLQNALIAAGHSLPAGATGYFGSQTKAAVVAWQRAAGVSPASGYFGPISQARFAAMGGSTPAAACPAGVTCTPTTPVNVTCPAGFTCTSNSGSGMINDGSDGSVTLSASALVSSGTAVKKGETRSVLSTRLKAINGPVAVNRVSVKFSERPWLTLSQVQLRDGNGNVLATKALTGSADATEVTVGSDYRVTFDNINLVVRPSSDVDLVVAVAALASSDKITGQTVTVNVPAGGIRTMNGKGFSETVGDSASFTYTLPSTGSNGDIYTSLAPTSPLAGFQTVAAGTTQTENITLGVFRIKSQTAASTLNSLSFNIRNSAATATTTLFSNVRLMAGSLSYGANSLVAGGGSTFTNLQVPLPLDQWVELKLTANVAGADTSSGVSASSTLVASTISALDTNFNTATITNASSVTSADRTFLQSGIGVSAASAGSSSCVNNVANGPIISCLATFNFTLTNTGSNSVYVSKLAGVALATSTVPTSTASSTITILTASNPSEDSSDTSSSFIIQSGASRTFVAQGAIKQAAGTNGPHQLKIDRIYFGASATNGTQGQASTNATSYLSSGLTALQATANF